MAIEGKGLEAGALAEAIEARPAVQRGRRVTRVSGEPAEQLAERHDATDLD